MELGWSSLILQQQQPEQVQALEEEKQLQGLLGQLQQQRTSRLSGDESGILSNGRHGCHTTKPGLKQTNIFT